MKGNKLNVELIFPCLYNSYATLYRLSYTVNSTYSYFLEMREKDTTGKSAPFKERLQINFSLECKFFLRSFHSGILESVEENDQYLKYH